MSSSVTSEKPFSETSRKAALRSARRRSASETWAVRGMTEILTDRSVRVNPEALFSHQTLRRIDLAAMRVQVLYFAAFRDAVGKDGETREVADRSTVADLWELLAGQVPYFSRFPVMPPAAVNREYAGPETTLEAGDEVAFLPPVAGG